MVRTFNCVPKELINSELQLRVVLIGDINLIFIHPDLLFNR